MSYIYSFYKFPSHTAFAAEWVEAGLPVDDGGVPQLPGGALDEIGTVEGFNGGWFVNAAWPQAAAAALDVYKIEPFEGLRVFAGWDAPQAPVPVPTEIDNSQVRIYLMRAGLFDQVDAAIKQMGGEAHQLWEYANKIYRYKSPMVEAMAGAFQMSSDDLDNMFRVAAKISG